MDWRETRRRSARIAGSAVSGPSRGRRFAPANVLGDDYDRYWVLPDDQTTASLTLEFPESRCFNRILLQEYIPLGQRIAAFHIDALIDGSWQEIARETTIGYKRIVLTPTVTATALRLTLDESLACPTLTRVGLYNDSVYCDNMP